MSLKDKLLGKEELKKKVEELEEELEEAERKREEAEEGAEKERERAREAITEKQELNEEINRKKDKIESLEGRVRKKEYVEEALGSEIQSNTLSREDLMSFIEKLGSIESDREDLLTAYIPGDSGLEKLSDGAIQNELTLNQLKSIQSLDWKTGKILFHANHLATLLVKPPLPVNVEEWELSDGLETSRLEKQLGREVGLIFLSAGGSAVCIFGEGVEKFRLVESEIKSKHSKGGFSQDRFERRREEEIKKHLERVEEAYEELLEGVETTALSGSGEMVNRFSSKLAEGEAFERKLNISSIESEEDVERAFREFWKSEVRRI